MKKIPSIALASALVVTGLAASGPADAQNNLRTRSQQKEAQQASQGGEAKVQSQAGERKYNLSSGGRKAIVELQKATDANDAAAFQQALAGARASASTADDKYLVGQFMLRDAIARDDDAAKVAAIDTMLQSGGATAEETPRLYENLAALHYNAQRFDQAAQSYEKLIEIAPNNTDNLLRLAELRAEQNNPKAAITLINQAIEKQKAAGQKPDENWYKRALRFAIEGNLAQDSAQISRELLAAYPTPTNWRDALIVYRDGAKLDKAAELDVLRLMRASKSLESPRDYQEIAEATHSSGLPGETKAVLEEGMAAGKVNASQPAFKELLSLANERIAEDRASLAALEKRAASAADGKIALNTADAYYGYGDYTKAAALYRTALQKGSVDANVANTRLGMALALSGQTAEAKTALDAVTGPRQEVANFWKVWLDSRA